MYSMYKKNMKKGAVLYTAESRSRFENPVQFKN